MGITSMSAPSCLAWFCGLTILAFAGLILEGRGAAQLLVRMYKADMALLRRGLEHEKEQREVALAEARRLGEELATERARLAWLALHCESIEEWPLEEEYGPYAGPRWGINVRGGNGAGWVGGTFEEAVDAGRAWKEGES